MNIKKFLTDPSPAPRWRILAFVVALIVVLVAFPFVVAI